jgi:hypothetical protein
MKLKELIEEVSDITPTSKNHGHSHYAKINKDGNGRTTTTSDGPNHKHYIKNWKALSSEDGHRHVVKKS